MNHPPVADISAYNAFKGSKASMRCAIGTTAPGAASGAPRREQEQVGFAMPFVQPDNGSKDVFVHISTVDGTATNCVTVA